MVFWEIEAKASHAEVLIYAPIGESIWDEDSVGARSFVKALKQLKANTIALRINSPGGSVFDGNTIYNALIEHPAKITTYVDGLAASIATIIALAGDRIVMAPNGMMMIHNPSGGAFGTAEEMRKQADMLDKLRDNMISQYVAKTGKTTDEISAAVDYETWLNAEEAVEFGLADEIAKEPGKAIAHYSANDFKSFRNTPAAAVALLEPRSDTRPTTNKRQEDTMDERLVAIRDALGLAESATEDEIRSAAAEALNGADVDDDHDDNGADLDNEADDENDNDGDDNPDAPATHVVDAVAFAALQRDAEMGRKAREQQIDAARKSLVSAAVRQGRIYSAQSGAYLAQLRQGGQVEVSARTLLTATAADGGLPPGTVPVDGERGVLGETSDGENAAAYDPSLFPEVIAKKNAIANGTNVVPLIMKEA